MVNSQRLAGLAVLLTGIATSASPSAADPLPRSHIVLPSAVSVDPEAHTATLPLHPGTAAGKTVWYIVTDSSEKADAANRKANFAPGLRFVSANCPSCVARVSENDGGFVYPGAPDFTGDRTFKAGPSGFPPAGAAPGAEGGDDYTPFIRVASGAIVNAPIVATGDAQNFDVVTHKNTADRVLAIDVASKTVTLLTAEGFADGKRVEYVSTEASDPGAAAIERATYVKHLGAATGVPIFATANGTRQGLAFDALKGGLEREASPDASRFLLSPDNILATFPTGSTASAYTPLWNANVGAFASSPDAGRILKSSSDVQKLVDAKKLTGPDGKAFGPAGFVVNYPVVAYVDSAP